MIMQNFYLFTFDKRMQNNSRENKGSEVLKKEH